MMDDQIAKMAAKIMARTGIAEHSARVQAKRFTEQELVACAIIRAVGNRDSEAGQSLMPDVDPETRALITILASLAAIHIREMAELRAATHPNFEGWGFDKAMDELVHDALGLDGAP